MRGSRKTARLGPLRIGGGSPVMVQSMTNTDTRDIGATLGQIEKLASLGCEAVRVAVLDDRAAACLKELHDKSPVPLIADIHFDYRLAIKAIEAGCASIPAISVPALTWTRLWTAPKPTAPACASA